MLENVDREFRTPKSGTACFKRNQAAMLTLKTLGTQWVGSTAGSRNVTSNLGEAKRREIERQREETQGYREKMQWSVHRSRKGKQMQSLERPCLVLDTHSQSAGEKTDFLGNCFGWQGKEEPGSRLQVKGVRAIHHHQPKPALLRTLPSGALNGKEYQKPSLEKAPWAQKAGSEVTWNLTLTTGTKCWKGTMFFPQKLKKNGVL